jgi:hypothetical protein
MSIVLPTTCKLAPTVSQHSRIFYPDVRCLVSEVIALKLRRPGTSHVYLYPQIFSGLSYLVASLCMLELARVLRKRHKPMEVAFRLSDSTLVDATKQNMEDAEKCEN